MSESDRLQALDEYRILDSFPEREYDEIVELTSAMFETPISFISLIESERQWFKSIKGLDVEEAERKYAFCNHTIRRPNEVMVVPDATKDDRFKDNPYVVDGAKIRFYAGTALVTEDNWPIGTLCVIDVKPREFTQEEARILQILAQRVMTLLKLRKENLKHRQDLILTKDELDRTLNRLIEAQATARIGSWDWDLKTDNLYWSPEMFKIFDITLEGGDSLFEAWMSRVHPDDKAIVKSTIVAGLKEAKDAVIEHRIIGSSGEVIWLETIGNVKIKNGKVVRMSGTVQEVTKRKKAELKKVIYTNALKDMMFNLSHKVRQPITNSLGLVDAFEAHDLSENTVQDFLKYLKASVRKIDEHIREMSDFVYNSKEELQDMN